MIDRTTIGKNIQDARNLAGLSQSETARRMNDAGHTNWTQMTVARTENGKRTIGAVELLDLAVIIRSTYTGILSAGPADAVAYHEGYTAGRHDTLASLRLTINHMIGDRA